MAANWYYIIIHKKNNSDLHVVAAADRVGRKFAATRQPTSGITYALYHGTSKHSFNSDTEHMQTCFKLTR